MIIQTGMRIDIPAFCTKNPAPMLSHMDVLKSYGQYWFVTITPYGKDIYDITNNTTWRNDRW